MLAGLFHTAYLYASVIRGFTHAVIEVNPRHVAFYGRALRFDPIGEERMNTRVHAPAVVALRTLCGDRGRDREVRGQARCRRARGARCSSTGSRRRTSRACCDGCANWSQQVEPPDRMRRVLCRRGSTTHPVSSLVI